MKAPSRTYFPTVMGVFSGFLTFLFVSGFFLWLLIFILPNLLDAFNGQRILLPRILWVVIYAIDGIYSLPSIWPLIGITTLTVVLGGVVGFVIFRWVKKFFTPIEEQPIYVFGPNNNTSDTFPSPVQTPQYATLYQANRPSWQHPAILITGTALTMIVLGGCASIAVLGFLLVSSSTTAARQPTATLRPVSIYLPPTATAYYRYGSNVSPTLQAGTTPRYWHGMAIPDGGTLIDTTPKQAVILYYSDASTTYGKFALTWQANGYAKRQFANISGSRIPSQTCAECISGGHGFGKGNADQWVFSVTMQTATDTTGYLLGVMPHPDIVGASYVVVQDLSAK